MWSLPEVGLLDSRRYILLRPVLVIAFKTPSLRKSCVTRGQIKKGSAVRKKRVKSQKRRLLGFCENQREVAVRLRRSEVVAARPFFPKGTGILYDLEGRVLVLETRRPATVIGGM